MTCENDSCLIASGEASSFPVSIFIENQLPRWAIEDHPKFIAFLEAYYEWMEKSNNAYANKYCLESNLDVDSTVDDFLKFFKKEYLHNIPEHLYEKSGCESIEFPYEENVAEYVFGLEHNENSEIKVYVDNVLVDSNLYSISHECGKSTKIQFDTNELGTIFPVPVPAPTIKVEICEDVKVNIRLLIKTIKEMNVSKGTPNSFRLLFKLLFNEEICIEDPSDFILRSSDGKWKKETPIPTTRTISFVATGSNNNKFSISRPENQIQSIEVNNVVTNGYTVADSVLTINSPVLVDNDVVDVFYKLPDDSTYFPFWYCKLSIQPDIVDPDVLLVGSVPEIPPDRKLMLTTNSGVPLNFTPTPNQSDIVIKRHRLVNSGGGFVVVTENIPRTLYTVLEETINYSGSLRTVTIIKISDAYSLVYATDGIEIEIKSGLNTTVIETVAGDSFVVKSGVKLSNNLGVFFNPDIAKPVVKINGFTVNPDTIEFSKINSVGNILDINGILTIPLDSLGVFQFGVIKNGILLKNVVDFSVDVGAEEISFTTPLVASDIIDVIISPAYTIIEDDFGGIPSMFVVFDSASSLSVGDTVDVLYSVKPPSGYFKNNDGKISSTMVLQDGYKYQEFSYIIQSNHSIDEYGEYLKNLLHPSGMIMFGQIRLNQCISWMINGYKYYTQIANVDWFPNTDGVPALGPTWHSFEINKFDYGLTKSGGNNTPNSVLGEEIIGDSIDKPTASIDLLLDSYICIDDTPPEPVVYPPFYIGGNFGEVTPPEPVVYPPFYIGGNF